MMNWRRNLGHFVALTAATLVLLPFPHLLAEDAPAQAAPRGKIAFISDRDEDEEIYTMNPDGTEQIRITKQMGTDTHPSWSPDGTRLAFHVECDDFRIYVIDLRGGEWQCLTPTTKGETASDGYPVFSPDGKKILFIAYPEDNFEVYVMNSDGSERKRLTRSKGDDTFPSWSPDGTRVVFASERDGNSEIYVMEADGTNQKRLTTNSYFDTMPAWSPDGKSIAFVSDRTGNYDIFLMDCAGDNQRQLTTNPANDACPSWSPDGAWLVFDSFRDGNHEIYMIKADGMETRRLTTNPAYDAFPSWSKVLSSGREGSKGK